MGASGDCKTDADCAGSKCVELTPGGFKVCEEVLVPAMVCSTPFDECCGSVKPCPAGQTCYGGPLLPYCGGAQMLPHNQCAQDQCASDAMCMGSQICLPSAVLGRKERACFPAACKHDSDCTGGPGGQCAPVNDPCCNSATGLFCVYAGGCRKNADCPQGSFCSPDVPAGSASCQPGAPVCPA
jgi:hypothetical protein